MEKQVTLNVTPKLVEPVSMIYRASAGAFTELVVFEGGFTHLSNAGDVPDLHIGITPPGHYRTCRAQGLVQLGSVPAAAITCDVEV